MKNNNKKSDTTNNNIKLQKDKVLDRLKGQKSGNIREWFKEDFLEELNKPQDTQQNECDDELQPHTKQNINDDLLEDDDEYSFSDSEEDKNEKNNTDKTKQEALKIKKIEEEKKLFQHQLKNKKKTMKEKTNKNKTYDTILYLNPFCVWSDECFKQFYPGKPLTIKVKYNGAKSGKQH